MIKKYLQFITESINGKKYACVMLEISIPNWNELTSMIDKNDFYIEESSPFINGVIKNPHVTILYGLEDNIESKIIEILKYIDKPIEIEINGIDTFENEKFDVVKFNVIKNETLTYLFNKLSELPNCNEYIDYNPHITIAYVKKGEGEKYKKLYNHNFKSNDITYQLSTGKKYKFKINLNESYILTDSEGNEIHYDAIWKTSKSKIRRDLERDLKDILYEITDIGYKIAISGFIKGMQPYIWIIKRQARERFPLDLNEIDDTVERVKDYLDINGYWSKVEIINPKRPTEQMYIYFDKKIKE